MKQSAVLNSPPKGTLGQTVKKTLNRDKYLLLLSLPAILYFAIFCYIPMAGNLLAFVDYKPGQGLFDSTFVGLRWFKEFFSSIYFGRTLKNTLILSFYLLIFSFPTSIAFALLLNEVKSKKFKSITQTLSYMPYFISAVIVVGIMKNILSPTDGIINLFLMKMGIEPIDFMASSQWFRALYVISDIWQNCGWGSIVYLGAISAVDPQLYEAAYMDGANRLQRLLHVTLPAIAPTIIMMLIIRMGSIMTVSFEKVLLMYSPITYEVSDVIQTYVYRKGILDSQYSFSIAVGLFNSVINFILVVLANHISKKVSDTSMW